MSYTTMVNASQVRENTTLTTLAQEPKMKAEKRNLAKICIEFIRNKCEKMGFVEDTGEYDERNLERDVDRLCLENALHRFAASGSKENAFDVYFCFSEIFKPFGDGYKATRVLLETLADHEENSSSLLMKHRDHYSHSVYVFMLGIAVFDQVPTIREAFIKKYQPDDEKEREKWNANHVFLKYWGMTSLFHDIGYPYEIAHQQIKAFAWKLDENLHGKDMNDPKIGYAPYVSYAAVEKFTEIPEKYIEVIRNIIEGIPTDKRTDMNAVFAYGITKRLGDGRPYAFRFEDIHNILSKRAVASMPFMDHAYFSGLILFKRMLDAKLAEGEMITEDDMDILISIMLHNSMFKFDLKKGFGREEEAKTLKDAPLKLTDGAPLAYLLMLCDELQCWDRIAYGQNSRREISPWDFDIFFDNGKIRAIYYYDEAYYEKAQESKSYNSMIVSDKISNKVKMKKYGDYKFVRDIDEIIDLELKQSPLLSVNAVFAAKKKMKKMFISNSNYMNNYDFAVVLNARYDDNINLQFENLEDATQDKALIQKMEKSFADLSLEFKLSNLAQARGFAQHLEMIDCFYTNRSVDYEMLSDFSNAEIECLARLEHERWMQEKVDMGWVYGDTYLKMTEELAREIKEKEELAVILFELTGQSKKDSYRREDIKVQKRIRAITRHHKDMVPLEKLTQDDILKDTEPMRCMIKLLELYDGLRIYRKNGLVE